MLAATGAITRSDLGGIVLIGELSLDGSIQPARGVLPIAAEARRHGARALLLPYDNLRRSRCGLGPASVAGANVA